MSIESLKKEYEKDEKVFAFDAHNMIYEAKVRKKTKKKNKSKKFFFFSREATD